MIVAFTGGHLGMTNVLVPWRVIRREQEQRHRNILLRRRAKAGKGGAAMTFELIDDETGKPVNFHALASRLERENKALVERVRRLEALHAAVRVVDDDLSVLEVHVPYQGSYVSGKGEEWQAVRAALVALDNKDKETKQ